MHDDTPEADPCGAPGEVPEGAAVLPLIPKELGIHPLLLAVLHAVVFLDGSSEDVLNDAAANEALNYLATYLQLREGREMAARGTAVFQRVPGRFRRKNTFAEVINSNCRFISRNACETSCHD